MSKHTRLGQDGFIEVDGIEHLATCIEAKNAVVIMEIKRDKSLPLRTRHIRQVDWMDDE